VFIIKCIIFCTDDIKFAEKQTEVVTQCLSVKTLQKFARSPKNDTLLENIVLKINAKCGGLNNELMTRQDPVYVFNLC